MTTRDRVLAAARRLFAEQGYARVGIRQVAAEAEVSPALVMKLCGSKEQLYAAASPREQSPLSPDWPTDRVGVELVRRLMARRDEGAVEPLLLALLGVLDSPDPAAARADFVAQVVDRIEHRTSPGEDQHQRAELAAAMLVGLAAAVRPLQLLPADADWVVERYGALIQSVIDG